MEQNDWTRQLHDRLENHKAAVPSGLWDDIERQLDAKSKSRKPRLVLRVAYWVSAAAAVALLIVGAFYTGHDASAPASVPLAGARQVLGTSTKALGAGTEAASQAETVSGESLLASAGKLVSSASSLNSASSSSPNSVSSMGVSASVGEASRADAAPDAAQEGSVLQQNVAENNAYGAAVAKQKGSKKVPSARNESENRRAEKRNVASETMPSAAVYGRNSGDKGASRWSVGAHTGNAFAESRSTMGATPVAGMYVASGKTDGNALFSSYPSIFAGYKEVKHHNQPLIAGVSVSYGVNSRIALTTGLVYTRVTSDFIQSAGSDEIADNQRLHYIGIPLGVNYNLWSNGRVRTYATAGAQVDFNVKATLTSEGATSDIGKDRPQVSGTVAVGVEYNIVPQLGLYAEPGVRYYFNNHSSVDNIFKDKPWTFSLQIGVRLNVK